VCLVSKCRKSNMIRLPMQVKYFFLTLHEPEQRWIFQCSKTLSVCANLIFCIEVEFEMWNQWFSLSYVAFVLVKYSTSRKLSYTMLLLVVHKKILVFWHLLLFQGASSPHQPVTGAVQVPICTLILQQRVTQCHPTRPTWPLISPPTPTTHDHYRERSRQVPTARHPLLPGSTENY
jgi:hypothetical protein